MAKAKPTPPEQSANPNGDQPTADFPTLAVNAFGIIWTVNAEPPSLAWIINAASGLKGWDLLAAVRRRDAAVGAVDDLVRRWYRLKAQREKNARLPREEQENPHLCDGPDDPDTAKYDAPEYLYYEFAAKDLCQMMEINYWLHNALLISPDPSLKATYKGLRVIDTLPRVYDHAREPITPRIWADAKRDYQDILADAYTALSARGGTAGQEADGGKGGAVALAKAQANGPRKELSPDAFKAYRAHKVLGMKQGEVAKQLKTNQGQVSRWVNEVAEWIKAGNILPDLPERTAKPVSVDPAVIDMGEREDHLTKRQRGKRSDDDEADE